MWLFFVESVDITSYYFLSGFSFTDTGDSQDSKGSEGTIFFSLYHFQPLTNIQTSICNFACEITMAYFWSHRLYLPDSTRWDLPPYWITIWLIDDTMLFLFVYLIIWFYVFVTTIRLKKLVHLSSHRLSPWYYKRTD